MSHRRGQDHHRVTLPWLRGAIAAWRNGCPALWPRGAREVRRSRRIAAAHGFATLASAGTVCHTRYTAGLGRPHWMTGPMSHWAGSDRPNVALSRLRTSGVAAGGAEGANGSGEIGSAERAGRALAGQARGWPGACASPDMRRPRHAPAWPCAGPGMRRPGLTPRRYELAAAPRPVTSFTLVAEVTGTRIYQVVASPIPTCCPFPPMGISHSD